MKILEKMDILEDVKEEKVMKFYFPYAGDLNPPLLLEIKDKGTFGYSEDEIILRDLNFAVDNDSKIALVGGNGAGKSTFLKLLLGNLELVTGK